MFFFFFFQAEDGIRDLYVTGVQTCALPILPSSFARCGTSLASFITIGAISTFRSRRVRPSSRNGKRRPRALSGAVTFKKSEPRSEERRVGKECRELGAEGQ